MIAILVSILIFVFLNPFLQIDRTAISIEEFWKNVYGIWFVLVVWLLLWSYVWYLFVHLFTKWLNTKLNSIVYNSKNNEHLNYQNLIELPSLYFNDIVRTWDSFVVDRDPVSFSKKSEIGDYSIVTRYSKAFNQNILDTAFDSKGKIFDHAIYFEYNKNEKPLNSKNELFIISDIHNSTIIYILSGMIWLFVIYILSSPLIPFIANGSLLEFYIYSKFSFLQLPYSTFLILSYIFGALAWFFYVYIRTNQSIKTQYKEFDTKVDVLSNNKQYAQWKLNSNFIASYLELVKAIDFPLSLYIQWEYRRIIVAIDLSWQHIHQNQRLRIVLNHWIFKLYVSIIHMFTRTPSINNDYSNKVDEYQKLINWYITQFSDW
jgi:hypothetical protein